VVACSLDSWFHAAVTQKLLRDGLPVTDPYFAGLRLQYMYFYHVILAACVSLTHIDALHAMIVVNAIALGVMRERVQRPGGIVLAARGAAGGRQPRSGSSE
jgi:hypothetical protein